MKTRNANNKVIEVVTAFKCVRSDGTDFKTGTLNYVAALKEGRSVEVLDADPPLKDKTGDVCGRGIHVSPTSRKTIQFADRWYRPWRWLEGTVVVKDIIEQDEQKMRVKRFTPRREIGLTEIFGKDFAKRIKAATNEAGTWKTIPWIKPSGIVSDKKVASLIGEWRKALAPWLKGKTLPDGIDIVREHKAAADVADAAADDADADAVRIFRWYFRWYVRPYHVLRRSARWQMFMEGPNPSAPLIELYRLGCLPIGFVKGKFIVYVPKA